MTLRKIGSIFLFACCLMLSMGADGGGCFAPTITTGVSDGGSGSGGGGSGDGDGTVNYLRYDYYCTIYHRDIDSGSPISGVRAQLRGSVGEHPGSWVNFEASDLYGVMPIHISLTEPENEDNHPYEAHITVYYDVLGHPYHDLIYSNKFELSEVYCAEVGSVYTHFWEHD